VPIFSSLEDFYRENSAELAIISTPIHTHLPLTHLALEKGSHVLCEKPVAGVIQDARQMIEARDRSGRFVDIGYDWTHTPEVQALKKDVVSGLFGRPIRLKVIALWPRSDAYYSRPWAARQRSDDGLWVLDSPINNAQSHFLHNMLYTIGETQLESAYPAEVVGELYRANEVETFDTCAARVRTTSGVELYFYGSHASNAEDGSVGPICHYEFEKATVRRGGQQRDFAAEFKDGTTKTYKLDRDKYHKVWQAIRAVRADETLLCSIEAAATQTVCINGLQESMPEIVDLPRERIRHTGEPGHRFRWVEGLSEALWQCHDAWKLPSEMGIDWSKPGRTVDVRGYDRYPSRPAS
jgi:predicted dehydrogenase